MLSGKTTGLIVCALALMAVILPGYAGETSDKAWAVWQGQGRFYKATDNLALFSGYFEGLMEVENRQEELNASSMMCPGILEVNLTDGTQQGWGRCVMMTGNGVVGAEVHYTVSQAPAIHIAIADQESTLLVELLLSIR
jgi:hypothetical protein